MPGVTQACIGFGLLLCTSAVAAADSPPVPDAGLLEFMAEWGEAGEWLDAELLAGEAESRLRRDEGDEAKDGRERDD